MPGQEADHSPPSSAQVNNDCSYNSTPPYAFTACTGTISPYKPAFYCVVLNKFSMRPFTAPTCRPIRLRQFTWLVI